MSQTPHDAFFKSIFSQPLQAAEVLQQALPPEVVRLLDFSTLTPEPGSFIDEALRGQCTDLLFSARFAGWPTLLYLLFEHMSTQEVFMPLRMSGYMNEIWKALVLAERPRHLPVIVPVVLHHSELGWRSRTSFQAMFDPELPAPLRTFVPHFHLALEDLSTRSDEELLAQAVSAITKMALSALKHARTAEDLLRFVPGWAQLVHDMLREPNGADAVARVFRYLSLVRGAGEVPILRRIAEGARDEAAMQTIAEMFEEQGLQKGVLIGERQVLIRLLSRRFGSLPARLLERIHRADAEALERWTERLLEADSLDDVFAAG